MQIKICPEPFEYVTQVETQSMFDSQSNLLLSLKKKSRANQSPNMA